MIKKDKFDALIETIPNFKKLIDKLVAKNYEAHQNRIFSSISETAEQRYDNFIKSYPLIYERIPLHMIASFLGLSRETLSRIRKQGSQKRPKNQ
jgi:CRP-like cAMP-binding protein